MRGWLHRMCLHSASSNGSINPRYVYFQSYFARSATYLANGVADYIGLKTEGLLPHVAPELRYLLDSRPRL